MRKLPFLLFALGGSVLAGCDDPPKQAAAPQDAPAADAVAARRAAEEQLRARLRMPGDLSLRAVKVYRQQMPDSLAVCGQVNPAGGPSDPFIPWVATISMKDGKAQRADLILGASNAEASRVYVDMIDRCFEGGGPRTAQAQATRALPPLPLDNPLATPVARSALAGAPANPVAAAGGGRRVTTTAAHPVNIRSQPGGSAAVVRILPRSSALTVFAEAPGGWLQVGEDQPFGWVHASVLER